MSINVRRRSLCSARVAAATAAVAAIKRIVVKGFVERRNEFTQPLPQIGGGDDGRSVGGDAEIRQQGAIIHTDNDCAMCARPPETPSQATSEFRIHFITGGCAIFNPEKSA